MRDVIEIVGNRQRLANLRRLGIASVGRVVQRRRDRRRSIISRGDNSQKITETVVRIRGCCRAGAVIWCRRCDGVNQTARFVIRYRGRRFRPFLNARESSQYEVRIRPRIRSCHVARRCYSEHISERVISVRRDMSIPVSDARRFQGICAVGVSDRGAVIGSVCNPSVKVAGIELLCPGEHRTHWICRWEALRLQEPGRTRPEFLAPRPRV